MPPKAKKKSITTKSAEGLTTPAQAITATVAGDLRPAGYNPRSITPEKLAMLNKAMAEFGDLGGIVFNTSTGRLIGGHQRVKNLDPTWPIIKEAATDATGTVAIGHIETPHGRFSYREVDWPEKKEKAANIAANKQGGDWDDDLVAQLLAELYQGGLDMDLVGFDQAELNAILGLGKETELGDEDPDTPPQENPWVKEGDLWQCGEHRLLCGDSTNLTNIDRLLDGKKADLCVVDPPYNVDYESKVGKIMNDKMSPEQFRQFLRDIFTAMKHSLKNGGVYYIYHADTEGLNFRAAVADVGLQLRQNLIWVKNAPTLSRSNYNWKHEPILYGWKDGAGHYFNEDYTQTSVIDEDIDISRLDKRALQAYITELRNAIPTSVLRANKPTLSDLHPTQKPVYLISKNIVASSREGEIVIDLCAGSSTVLIACHKHGRRAMLMELDPRYAQAGILRWQQYCNQEPVLVNEDGSHTPLKDVERQRKTGSKQ